MYSDGQQALLGSRNAPWLGRGTAGSCGAWRNSPGVFDFLKKKITLLSKKEPFGFAIQKGINDAILFQGEVS